MRLLLQLLTSNLIHCEVIFLLLLMHICGNEPINLLFSRTQFVLCNEENYNVKFALTKRWWQPDRQH
jgi:hypothetical protein